MLYTVNINTLILDQQSKQSLHFSGGRSLAHVDGRTLVASSGSIYAVVPVPLETQLQGLLQAGNVEAALRLAEDPQSGARASSKDQFQATMNHVRQRAAFARLETLDLDGAKELFVKGRVDPREVISLFPNLLPSSTSFVRAAAPPLHDLPGIAAVSKGDADIDANLKTFLAELLYYLRISEGEEFAYKKEVDTALLKLYSASGDSSLSSYVSELGPDLRADLDDCSGALEAAGRHDALAHALFNGGKFESALERWAKLVKGEVVDGSQEENKAEKLKKFARRIKSSPSDLRWKFADLVLSLDELTGVEIFLGGAASKQSTPSDEEEESFQAEQEKVLRFLSKYRKAHLLYLEDLVLEKESKIESFHTQLASTYLDLLLQNNPADEMRGKFQTLIVKSDVLSAPFLLSRLEKTELHQEKAILYGKMGDHDRALRTLVYQVKDYPGAEKYCDQITASNTEMRQNLLHNLVKIYTDNTQSLEDIHRSNCIDLINRRGHEMKVTAVYKLLPDHWSLSSVSRGLGNMMRSNQQERRDKMLEAALRKSENLNIKLELIKLKKTHFTMEEGSYCMSCKKGFTDHKSFARYPNGIIVHEHCAKDPKVCPVTGEAFAITRGTMF